MSADVACASFVLRQTDFRVNRGPLPSIGQATTLCGSGGTGIALKMSTAMAAGDAGSGKSSTLFETSTDLPQFPGDQDVLAHVATTFRNAAEARLASRGLLAVAQGGMPPAAAQIINVDLTELPELPVDHRDHNRRKETRIRTITANKANDVKRKQLIFDAWTEIYGLVYKSVEVSAPVLAQELKDHCDLATTSGMPGGYFDGPRAWAILLDRLSSDGRRTEADKDFYRAAERVQRSAKLANGCLSADYSKKALAFLIHIKPNLPQSYDDDDTTQYLINLMPEALKEGGRRIKNELRAEGKYHDFMHVIKCCRELVQEEQKSNITTPAFVVSEIDMAVHDVRALSNTTGMFLSFGNASGLEDLAGVGYAGTPGNRRWCKGCPHTNGCFEDPGYEGPLPINVHVNKERREGIERSKAANAKIPPLVPLKLLKAPSAKSIEEFRKKRDERRKKAKERDAAKDKAKAPAGAAAIPGGAAVSGQEAWWL